MTPIVTDVMLDLETMDQGPDAAIVAIGAVSFDLEAGKLGSEFYTVVDITSSVEAGGKMDPSTVLWWLQQSEQARSELKRAGRPIRVALAAFADWLVSEHGPDVKVWGNGADFDNVILGSAYRRLGKSIPWAFYNSRCYRTVKSLQPGCRIERAGTHHNALDDAKSQALHLMRLLSPTPSTTGATQ